MFIETRVRSNSEVEFSGSGGMVQVVRQKCSLGAKVALEGDHEG